MTLEPLTIVAAAFVALNAVAFAVFAFDKIEARRGARRVRERTLHVLALLGGFAGGAAGIVLFRHKTRKAGFLAIFVLASAVSVAAWWAIARSLA